MGTNVKTSHVAARTARSTACRFVMKCIGKSLSRSLVVKLNCCCNAKITRKTPAIMNRMMEAALFQLKSRPPKSTTSTSGSIDATMKMVPSQSKRAARDSFEGRSAVGAVRGRSAVGAVEGRSAVGAEGRRKSQIGARIAPG